MIKNNVVGKILKRNTYVKHLPEYLQIEPTVRCNANCRMCNRMLTRRLKGNLSFEGFVYIIEQIPSIKSVLLQGVGEPLLNPYFFDMVKYLKDRDIKVYTNTNASLINEYIAKKIVNSQIDEVRISFDAVTNEKYEYIRQGLNFNLVKENIIRLSTIKKEMRSDLPDIQFSIVGMMYNLEELPKIVDFAYKVGVSHIQILNLFLTGYDLGRKENSLVYNYGIKVQKILLNTKILCEKYGIKYTAPVFDYNITKNLVQQCKWPWRWTNITFDGYVTPCCVVDNPKILNMGNVFEENFQTIWNNERYRSFRKHFLLEKIPSVCQQCLDNRFILKYYGGSKDVE